MFDNTIMVAQILTGKRKPEGKSYYGYDIDHFNDLKDKPRDREVITLKDLEDVLFEEYKNILKGFIASEDNKDVYCCALWATAEYNEIILYINNEVSHKKTVADYMSKYPKFSQADNQRSLRYGLGDFPFMFSNVDKTLSNRFKAIFDEMDLIRHYLEDGEVPAWLLEDLNQTRYFTSDIFDHSFYYLGQRVFNRLKPYMQKLDCTDDFISFMTPGDDYLELSITIRQSVEEKLFYKIFPDLEISDRSFQKEMYVLEEMDQYQRLGFVVDEMMDNINRTSELLSGYTKTEYDLIVYLNKYLSVDDCIDLLESVNTDIQASGEMEDYRRNYAQIYVLCQVIYEQGGVGSRQKEAVEDVYDYLVAQSDMHPYIKIASNSVKKLLK